MPEPSTHYQLSFTTRQAMVLFVGLLLALGAAYFLGLMTGLESRETVREAARLTPTNATPEPTPEERVASASLSPTAIRPPRTPGAPIPSFPKPVLGKEPTATSIQFFEDGSESETTPAAQMSPTARPAPKGVSPRRSPTAEPRAFWVQVVSATSEKEAKARRDRLIHRGYNARVLIGEGPKGKIYRVRVGPFSSREDASRASDRLSHEEKVKTWIAPPGK